MKSRIKIVARETILFRNEQCLIKLFLKLRLNNEIVSCETLVKYFNQEDRKIIQTNYKLLDVNQLQKN